MKSKDAGFTLLAPGIDRVFRFLEMVGVTALLSVVIPQIAGVIRFVGAEMALYYLLEPAIDKFSYWMVPEVNGRPDLVRIGVIGMICFAGLGFATGPVAVLGEQITRTIAYPPAAGPQEPHGQSEAD